MFDLNAIVSAAITEAVNTRITEVLAQHANIVGGLAERIAALEDKLSMLTSHGVKTFENVDALTTRVVALETKLTEANLFTQTANVTADAFVTHLDNQEWFWEKLQNRIDSTVEAGIDDHCSNYDHDSYDEAASKVDDLPDLDDYVTRDEVRSEIEDVLNNATLSLSI